MSTHSPDDPSPAAACPCDERQRQLLEVAWRLVREEGTEALTLGRLAEQAEVTKPVVYDHFGTRARLLAAPLPGLRPAPDGADGRLPWKRARGDPGGARRRHRPRLCRLRDATRPGDSGWSRPLASSPELERIKRDYEVLFMDKCRAVLERLRRRRTADRRRSARNDRRRRSAAARGRHRRDRPGRGAAGTACRRSWRWSRGVVGGRNRVPWRSIAGR